MVIKMLKQYRAQLISALILLAALLLCAGLHLSYQAQRVNAPQQPISYSATA